MKADSAVTAAVAAAVPLRTVNVCASDPVADGWSETTEPRSAIRGPEYICTIQSVTGDKNSGPLGSGGSSSRGRSGDCERVHEDACMHS